MPSFELFVYGFDVEVGDVVREISYFFTVNEVVRTDVDVLKNTEYIAFHHGKFGDAIDHDRIAQLHEV